MVIHRCTWHMKNTVVIIRCTGFKFALAKYSGCRMDPQQLPHCGIEILESIWRSTGTEMASRSVGASFARSPDWKHKPVCCL